MLAKCRSKIPLNGADLFLCKQNTLYAMAAERITIRKLTYLLEALTILDKGNSKVIAPASASAPIMGGFMRPKRVTEAAISKGRYGSHAHERVTGEELCSLIK